MPGSDRANDLGRHPWRRQLEDQLASECLLKFVRVARVHLVHVGITGDVGTGKAQIAATRSQIGRAPRCLQLQPERRVGQPAGLPSYAVK